MGDSVKMAAIGGARMGFGLATLGNMCALLCGGEDFDHRVMEHFIELYKKKKGLDIRTSNRAVQTLRREVEKAKRALSAQHLARIDVGSFFNGEDFSETLTRAKFEELNMDFFRATVKPMQQVLEDADLQKDQVDEIVLVGGSTRIVKIQELVKDFFNGKKPSRGINPDEAVAHGAAVQAAVLGGEDMGELVLLDVNPLTLGIETVGGIMTTLIRRNTVIPTMKFEMFTTAADNQQTLPIRVYEGERSMTTDNYLLGRFDLTGIEPAPRGVAKIKVTFKIDANGILQVSAEDEGTGNTNSIVINDSQNRLTSEDIDRMINDARKFSEEDKKSKERVEVRNELERYAYLLKTQIGNKEKLRGKLSSWEMKTIENALYEHMEWLQENQDADIEDFKEHKRQLVDVVQPIIGELYQGAGGPLSTDGEYIYEFEERDEL